MKLGNEIYEKEKYVFFNEKIKYKLKKVYDKFL